MSDKFERVQLTEDQEELIAGGRIVYRATRDNGSYLWSKSNPDVKYAFDYQQLYVIQVTIDCECAGKSDDYIISYLMSQNLIVPA